MARHLVLLGDSIFDNAGYVAGGPDVAAQLRERLDQADRVTLKAMDGGTCDQVVNQFRDCPSDATHLIVSAGGNDILHQAAMLQQPVDSVGHALELLSAARDGFAVRHARMVEAACAFDLPVAICTIYDTDMGELIASGLSIFNDAITRNVHAAGLDLIDLRLVCDDPADYANPIEPSVAGGDKIAAALLRYADEVEARTGRTRAFF